MNALALLVLTLLVVVPGFGAVLAAFPPGRPSVPLALALAVTFGYAVDGAAAFVLAVAHILHPYTFFPVAGGVAAVLWAIAFRRGSPRARLEAFRQGVRAQRGVLLAGAAVIVAIAAIRLAYPPALNLSSSSVWRYWADGREVADAGRFPAHVLQYGTLYAPTTNKAFLSAFEAVASFATGRQPLPAVGALAWIGSVGLALSLWALANELGLRWTGVLLPVLAVMDRLAFDRELTGDLLTYKAETFGRMAAFAGVALAARALRRREGARDAVLAGCVFAAVAATHLVPVIIAALLVAGTLVGRVVADRALAGLVPRGLVVLATTVAGGAALLFLPSGTIGLSGATGSTAAYGRFAPGFDPTRYLNAGVLPGHAPVAKGTWALSAGRVLRAYATAALHVGRHSALARHAGLLALVLILGGLALAAAIAVWFPLRLRTLGLAAWTLMAGIVAATWLFSNHYTFYIQAFFGIRRLFDYSSIPIVMLGLGVIEAASGVAARRFGRRAVIAGVVVFVVGVSAIVLPSGRKPAGAGSRAPEVLASLDWIRANVPCDAVILANVHAEGAFEALTGRAALLEGVTPYLRPDVLVPVLRLMLDARAFLHDPAAHSGFLRRHGVTHVVVLRAGGLGYSEPIGRVDVAGLRAAPFLRLTLSTPGADVFEVVGARPSPLPAAPGYECARDPLAA